MSKGTISGWMVATALISAAALAETGEAWVRFSEDGQRIVVAAQGDGFSRFESVSSAACKLDDQWHRIGTRSHKMVKPIAESTVETLFGTAAVSTATYGNEQFHYTLTLKRLKEKRAFTLQGVLHNLSGKDVTFNAVDLLDLSDGLAVGNPADWLVTPLMEASPAGSLHEMDKELNEAALIYNKNNKGFWSARSARPKPM